MSISLILMIVATVLLFCAAFGVPSTRVNLMALGLALWALAEVVTGRVVA